MRLSPIPLSLGQSYPAVSRQVRTAARRWSRALALGLCLAGVWLVAGLAVRAAGPSLPPLPGDAPPSTGDRGLSSGDTVAASPTPACEQPATPSGAPRPSLPWPWVRSQTLTPLPPLPTWLATAFTPNSLLAGQWSGIVTGIAAPGEVSLGDDLEYTLVVTNTSGQGATINLLYDVLPVPTRDDDVFCQPDCGRDVEVIKTIIITPDQYGAPPYTETITLTHRVRWADIYLPNGASVTAEFAFPIEGLDDGARLYNRAYVRYRLDNNETGTGMSDQIETIVRVPVPPGGPIGLSDLPVWYSEDYGGTGRLDWGDYDRDGNLDLAVGGSTGTTVYHNSDGHLTRLWTSDAYTHDVHWLEIDGDGLLELVSIGYNWWADEDQRVSNHVYHLGSTGDRFEDMEPTALAGTPLLAVEPVDVDADGDLDLVAVTYSRWTTDGCSIRLYPNDGNWFDTPYRCLATVDQAYDKVTESFLSIGDYNNDDRPDLLVDLYDLLNDDPNMPCSYRDMLWLVPNDGGSFTTTAPIPVDLFTRCNFPVRAAWGDYDHDGDLDLAVAVPALTSPNEDEVRVYENRLGEAGAPFTLTIVLTQPHDQPSYAVRWSDFNADSFLDLAVGAMPYRIYLNSGGAFSAADVVTPPQDNRRGFALDLAVADYDNDGDVDIATGNPLAASALYAVFASRLTPSLSTIDSWSSSSVAWGDANGDGTQDLLFGAGENTVDAELYLNVDGQFSNHSRFSASGFGPHSVAFGNVDGDGQLEIALGTAAEIQLYQAGEYEQPFWTSPPGLAATSLAWADADDDGDLDLAAATFGPIYLFDNIGGTLSTTPVWTSTETADTRSLAWADVDGDHYIDLAAGVYGQASRVYHNNGDGTFTATWNTLPRRWSTTSLAWADYDLDGDPDLALGNDGQPNVIYQNDGGSLGAAPVWVSDEISHTTALAWGDWDNDGNLDLAVGNNGEPSQVYLNLGSRPDRPRLTYLWRSGVPEPTTGLAWGDVNGDGDLDLAVSGDTHIGLYTNYGILSSHLVREFARTIPLPDNQSYLSVERPGDTPAAYFYSAPALLSGPDHPTVTIEYTLFDADGTRDDSPPLNEFGDSITSTIFEYSLDGGGVWQPATPGEGCPNPVTTTRRLGQPGRFVWDALADAAIADDARFRVTILGLKPAGPVQHVLTRAVSPPFRIRGTTCIWPIHPAIQVSDPAPSIDQSVTFVGTVSQASGILTFTWDYDDGGTAQGQVVHHSFARNNTYTVRLTVTSEPCPEPKILRTYREIHVGTGLPDLYLPTVCKGYGSGEP